MSKRAPRSLFLPLISLLAVGCQFPGAGPLVSPTGEKPRSRVIQPATPGQTGGLLPKDNPDLGQGAGIISRDSAGIISRDSAGIISRDSAGIISRDSAGFSGVARIPAGIISRDSAGIISRDSAGIISRDSAGIISRDSAGYQLAALPEDVPIRKQLVYLMNAEGKLILGADNEPITAETDESGRFEFKGFVNQKHVFLAIKLYDDKGFVKTIVPRSEATERTVDLNLASTLTATYIQEQYVRSQADPVSTLERLPAELEASTRAAVTAALAKADAPPAALTAEIVIETVDRLRTQEAGVDRQFEEVKRVLLAGLSDQGAGQPADSIETDAYRLAVGPAGQVVFASSLTLRVWSKDAAGRLVAIAGTGFEPTGDVPVSGAAPGDGGPATAAAVKPAALTYMPDGALLIADSATRRIRKVSPDGTISTVASSADWEELRDVLVEPDGSLVVATHSAIWRVPPGGQPVRIAGIVRPFDEERWFYTSPSGDGGKPTDATFRGISSIARDPLSGDIFASDVAWGVRRFNATTITRAVGTGVPGFSGDGAAAARAQIGAIALLSFRPDGTLLISDSDNRRIREVADGTIRTIVGNGQGRLTGDGGPASAAGLAEPTGVAHAPNGTVYLIDGGYVRLISNGTIRTIIGGTKGFDQPRPATDVQLLGPRGLTYDPAAHAMWIEDDRHVWRWTLDDNQMVSVFGGGMTGAPFSEGQAARETSLIAPRSVVPLGPDRYAVIGTDLTTQLGRVVQVEGGKMTTLAGGGINPLAGDQDAEVREATILGVDSGLLEIDGWYYYNLSVGGRIRRFQPGGRTEAWGGYGTQTGGGYLVKDYNFYIITAMMKGPDGQIYIGTPSYIYRIDPATGQVTHLAGSASGSLSNGLPATQSKLNRPSAFAWDADGHLYFAEPSEGRVRRLRLDSGVIEVVVGAGTPNLAGNTVDTGLGEPKGLAFDKNGDLYVADVRHGQIKVVRKAQLSP